MSRPRNLKLPGVSTQQTAEGRVSTVRWDPKGMRRSTGPQSRERSRDEPLCANESETTLLESLQCNVVQ